MAGLHRVAAECCGYNVGAARLYRRLGFVQEGGRGIIRGLMRNGMIYYYFKCWRASGRI